MAAVASQNERRALTLLRLINDDARASVLGALPERLRNELKSRIRENTFTETLPSARSVARLLEDFQMLFDSVVSITPSQLKLHHDDYEEEEELQPYQLSGNLNRDLERMNLNQLVAALNDEQPRTVAILLSRLSTKRVAAILPQLSKTQRSVVAREMTRQTHAPEIVFEKIASSTVQRAATLSPVHSQEENQILRMANVFREIDKSERADLLESIRSEDPSVAGTLQRALYRFEDLLELDDRTVQSVLSLVDSTTLQTALYQVSPEIIEKIMRNLSRRAAATLKEELAYQRNVPANVLNEARGAIAAAIGEVDAEGGR